MLKRTAVLMVVACVAVFACVFSTFRPDLSTRQIRGDVLIPLSIESAVGQTFRPGIDGLSAVSVSFRATGNRIRLNDITTLELRRSPEELRAIATARVWSPLLYILPRVTLTIPNEGQNLDRVYLLIQSTSSPGAIALVRSEGDQYVDGELWLNGVPEDYDLQFFAYRQATVEDLFEQLWASKGTFFIILAFSALYAFIGCIFVSILFPSIPGEGVFEKAVIGTAVGIALAPLWMYALSIGRVPANEKTLLASLGCLCAAWCCVQMRRHLRLKISLNRLWTRSTSLICPSVESLMLTVILLLSAFARAAQPAGITTPFWMDSYFHHYILEELVQASKLPLDLNYPPGFHANSFILAQWSRLPLHQVVQLSGQWVSFLTSASLFPLARRLLGETGGLFAIILYSFFATFPSYLFNWGRFPFLLALALISVAAWLAHDLFYKPNKASAVCLALVIAGISLTHYGSLVILSSLLIPLLLNRAMREMIFGVNISWSKIIPWLWIFLPTVGILVLRAGWLVTSGEWELLIQQTSDAAKADDQRNVISLILRPTGLLVLLFACLGLRYARAARYVIFTTAWVASLTLLTLLQFILVGAGISSFSNLFIFLALPLSLLAGAGLTMILPNASSRMTSSGSWAAFLLIVVAFAGAYRLSFDLNPSSVTYTRADEKAMHWIQKNAPVDAVFLVQSFLWNGKDYPADGGGWIETITGRKIILSDREEGDPDFLYFGTSSFVNAVKEGYRYHLLYDVEGVRIYEQQRSE